MLELADGRVLVHDATERTLGIADFRSGEFAPVAREGSGPLEYRSVGALVRMPGDSVALWDAGNSRVLVLTPTGMPVATAGERTLRFPVSGRTVPRGVDSSGRWYLYSREFTSGDSTAVVRLSPLDGRRDTLATFAVPHLVPRRVSQGVVRALAPGFPARDAWGVFPDGRVLVIHGATYSPEIIRPDGARQRVAPIPFVALESRGEDREGHLKDVGAQMERMLSRESGGAGRVSVRVEVAPPERWQEELPPLRSDLLLVDSKSRAWVPRTSRGPEERYDLLDVGGRLVDAVRLPAGATLVAMGKGVFYATREDADGLVYLQRYPLP